MGKNDFVRYLFIPSWDKHQEKRTNAKGEVWRPPWIKVMSDNSTDYAYSKLTIRQRGLLVEMWKLAGRLDNQIPHDPAWIKQGILTVEDISDDLNILISSGFVGRHVTLAESLRKDDVLEVEIEVEIESPNGDADSVARLFDLWKSETGRDRARLTDNRRQKLKARLKTFTEAELASALRGVTLDPWNDRKHHDDLAIVFRSDEQVEKFLALADDVSVLSLEQRRERHLSDLKERGVA